MSRRGHCWQAALVLGWLASSLLASAQASPELRHPVRLTPGRRSLGAVLAELSRQSRLPFSYSSSLVPLAHRYQVRPGPARPAGTVLREVLAAEHLAYGWLAGQVVLWPDYAPTPPGVTAVNGELGDAGIASVGREQIGAALRPFANAAPTPPPGTKLLTLPVAARVANRPATSRLPNSKLGVVSTFRPATLAGGRKATAGAKRSASSSQPVPVTALKTTAALGLQPGYSARYQPGKQAGRATRQVSLPNVVAPTTTPAVASNRAQPLAQLPLKLVDLQLVNRVAELSFTLGLPAGAHAELPHSPASNQPPDLSPSWKGLYLHGEAWVSESLPVGAVAKVGVARAYLVLGVAAASEHHLSGAWGVGLGTAGRPRGRFTPSLDVVHWFLGHDGDDDARPTHLTQLRPLLAWQLKREGRWMLLLGPTLNLATADSHGAQRGGFGHNQWLLVDRDDEHASVRFWPGVQVGLRF